MNKILIIEDEPAIASVVKIMLERAGYQAYICDNGREALDFVNKIKPNLIILDVMLPGMDGIAIADALNKNEETAAIPIIVASALEESKNLFRSVPQVRDFSAKPFDFPRLIESVKKAIG